jgi:hypothetical protein
LRRQLDDSGLSLRVQPSGAVVNVVELLPATLDATARALRLHVPLVQRAFGSGAHLRLLQTLQREVDARTVPLLRRFAGDRELAAVARRVRAHMRRGGNNHNKDRSGHGNGNGNNGVVKAPVDPAQLNHLLEEVACLARESEVFDQSLR